MKQLGAVLSFGLILSGCVGDAPVGGPDASAPDTSTSDTGTDTSMPDTSAPDAPSAFTPAKLSGLVLWLDAQETSTLTVSAGKVSKWADRTSYQTHALATPGYEPTVGTDALTTKPVLLFNKSFMTINTVTKTELEWGATSDFTIALVASYAPPSGSIVFRKILNSEGFQLVNVSGETRLRFGVDLAVTGNAVSDDMAYNDAKLRLYTLRRKGSGLVLEMRVNGTSTATKGLPAVLDVSALGAPIQLGARDGTTDPMTGAMGEIVAIDGPLSDPDLAALEAYLKTKWGL